MPKYPKKKSGKAGDFAAFLGVMGVEMGDSSDGAK
jgi:hypothetical protein